MLAVAEVEFDQFQPTVKQLSEELKKQFAAELTAILTFSSKDTPENWRCFEALAGFPIGTNIYWVCTSNLMRVMGT
jgi:hypothetical protein